MVFFEALQKLDSNAQPEKQEIPTNIGMLINSGDFHTSELSLNLQFIATNASEMYLTDKKDCVSGGTWGEYKTSSAWELDPNLSQVELFVKFRNAEGLESSCISEMKGSYGFYKLG